MARHENEATQGASTRPRKNDNATTMQRGDSGNTLRVRSGEELDAMSDYTNSRKKIRCTETVVVPDGGGADD